MLSAQKQKDEVVEKVNSFQMMRRIFNKEGLFGFTHGLSATYYGALLGGMVYFTTYKLLKQHLKYENTNENQHINSLAYLSSSLVANLLMMITYCPFDLIRTRMQARTSHNYHDLIDAFKQIVDKKSGLQGLKRLYVGATPSFIMNMVNGGLVFSIVESMRDYFLIKGNKQHVKDLGFYEYHTCSIMAGIVAGAITNILEVITINKQILGKKFSLRKFIKEDGFHSLKSGILARMILISCQA